MIIICSKNGENTTGIISTTNFTDFTDKAGDGWYDLQGRKLQGKPSQKGVYIYIMVISE